MRDKSAPKIPPDVQGPIDKFLQAIESREPARMHEAYLTMPKRQLDMWEKTVFGRADTIRATAKFLNTSRIMGTHATVDFDMHLKTSTKNGTPGTSSFRYRASLLKRGGKWELENLKLLDG